MVPFRRPLVRSGRNGRRRMGTLSENPQEKETESSFRRSSGRSRPRYLPRYPESRPSGIVVTRGRCFTRENFVGYTAACECSHYRCDRLRLHSLRDQGLSEVVHFMTFDPSAGRCKSVGIIGVVVDGAALAAFERSIVGCWCCGGRPRQESGGLELRPGVYERTDLGRRTAGESLSTEL